MFRIITFMSLVLLVCNSGETLVSGWFWSHKSKEVLFLLVFRRVYIRLLFLPVTWSDHGVFIEGYFYNYRVKFISIIGLLQFSISSCVGISWHKAD